jgi:hypothetical protein
MIGSDAFESFSVDQNPPPGSDWAFGEMADIGSPFVLYDVELALISRSPIISWQDGRTQPNVSKNVSGGDLVLKGTFFSGADFLHAEPGPGSTLSVVRWTSPGSGAYRVRGEFRSDRVQAPLTTTSVFVLQGATQIFFASVSGLWPSGSAFDQRVQTSGGDAIDFAVSNGNGSANFDGTAVKATVYGLACDDGDPCTADLCDGGSACAHTQLASCTGW